MFRPTPLLILVAAVAGCTSVTCPPAAAPDPGAYVRGRVATADAEGAPGVEAAEVTLADAAGEPIPGLPRARTDAQGEFLAPDVPPGHAYVVVARYPGQDGEDATLKTLARPGTDPAAFQDLSPATTILTTALTQGRSGLPGDFSQAVYDRAVDLVGAKLAAGGAPDLDDAQAMVAWIEARAAEDAALADALAELRPQVAAGPPRAAVEAEAAQALDPDPLDALKPIY